MSIKRKYLCFLLLAALTISADCPSRSDKDSPGQEPVPVIRDKYDMIFGVNGGMYPPIEDGEDNILDVTKDLDKLGMVWLRHPSKGANWFEVQPTKETWNFNKLDAVLKNNNHPWVFEIYGEKGTVYPFGSFSKEYMESLPDKKAIMDYIKAHAVDLNDPVQRVDAELYVKTFVNRYKDRIKYWEIGNEGLPSSNRYDIITYTYAWIKEAYSEAVILVTGVAGDDYSTFNEHVAVLDSLLAQGVGNYFNVANIHYYGRTVENFEEHLETVFDNYKGVLDKYGVQKPIWVTETSTSSHENSILSGPSSEEIQSRHIVKRPVIFLAKGAKKVFWHDYKATYANDLFYQCNLVCPDTNIPKPSYYTFILLIDKLAFLKAVETVRKDDVRLYKFTTDTDETIFVSWSRTPQNISLSAYIDKENVLVTHIVEDRSSTQPKTESVNAKNVPVTDSPIFIQ